MDFDIVPQLVILFSIAGILVIVGRNFSKVKEAAREEIFLEEGEKEKAEKEKFLYLYKRAMRRINKENYQKKMADFWLWLEKLLRKIRIVVLKLDSKMVGVLEHLRKKNLQSLEDWKQLAEKNMLKAKETEMLTGFLGGAAYRKHRRDRMQQTSTMPEETVIQQEEVPAVSVVERYSSEEQKDGNDVEEYVAEEIQVEQAEEDVESVYPEEVPAIFAETGNDDSEKMDTEEVRIDHIKAEDAIAVMEVPEEEQEDEEEDESQENETIRTRKEEECIQILMKDPADIKAYWRLGLIYSKRRNYEDALACFRQIVKIDPTYTKAKQKAIELMEKMKKRGK